MAEQRAIPTAPEPLEAYARHFDELSDKDNQREAVRQYLDGLLLPTERHKTLATAINTRPAFRSPVAADAKMASFL